MKKDLPDIPDIARFETAIFKKRHPLRLLLRFSRQLMRCRHVGLLYGTDNSYVKYLPPERWDRGVMHLFDGRGWSGLTLRLFGRIIVKSKGLSPVLLYESDQTGGKQNSRGIISYVLRKHKDFYGKGVKILLIDIEKTASKNCEDPFSTVSLRSYDGDRFQVIDDLMMNNAIVRQFRSQNFVSAYVPDYGAIVFDTVDPQLLEREKTRYIREDSLKQRLNRLIQAIEMASLAHIGKAPGKWAADIIWRKEKYLRNLAFKLEHKRRELAAQRQYLRAVGAVTERQLNMQPVDVPDGVYAFMDMVGSATVRRRFSPKDYFFVLNLCHQIAADSAAQFSCRVDNFIGDCVFMQSASPFDPKEGSCPVTLEERVMVMMFTLSAIFNQIHALKQGCHPIDREGAARKLIQDAQTDICFRAGIEIGGAMIGPLGSQKRKVVTAIGKSVNNASRLESSGRKNHIHISDTMMQMLSECRISRKTPFIMKIMAHHIHPPGQSKGAAIDYLSAYKRYFGLDDPVFIEQADVSYKEFKEKKTCLVRCIPGLPCG